MKINQFASDDAVLMEMGERLLRRRVELNLTQAQLASQAGVSKRTVERIEAGHSAQSVTLLRMLRALDLLAGVDRLLPEPAPSPMELLERRSTNRQRVRRRESSSLSDKPWSWGDDA